MLEEDFETGLMMDQEQSLRIFKSSYFKRLYSIAVIHWWTYSSFTGSTLFSEVDGNGQQGGFLLDEVLNAVATIHLRFSFLCERENEDI